MDAHFTTIMVTFSLPTRPVERSRLTQDATAQPVGVGGASGSGSGGQLPAYIQQVDFLKRVSSQAWNVEFVRGKSSTDPGYCIVRYPPISLRTPGTGRARSSRLPPLRKRAREGDVVTIVVDGVTANVSSNGAVSVMCSHTDMDAALSIACAVKKDLLKALAGKAARGLMAECEEEHLLRFVFSNESEPSVSAASASMAELFALSEGRWDALARQEVRVRSFTAYLYPIVPELLRMRQERLLRVVTEVASQGEDVAAVLVNASPAITVESSGSAGSFLEETSERVAAVRAARRRQQERYRAIQATGRGSIQVNVRGDAGVHWLETFLAKSTSREGEEGQVMEALCEASSEVLLSDIPLHTDADIQEELAGIKRNLVSYLSEKRAALRHHLQSCTTSRLSNRQGIQLLLKWIPGASPPEKEFDAVVRGKQRKSALDRLGPVAASPSAASVFPTDFAPSVFSTSSAEFFFMESTLPRLGGSGGGAGGAFSLPSVGGGGNPEGEPSLADVLKASPSVRDGKQSSSGTIGPAGSSTMTRAIGGPLPGKSPSAYGKLVDDDQMKKAVKAEGAPGAHVLEPEPVNCIIFGSGKVQFVSGCAEALEEVVQGIIFPFLLCTGEVRA